MVVPRGLAPVMTFLTYVRRFTVSTAALAVSRHAVDPSTATCSSEFSERTTTRLDDRRPRASTDVAGGAGAGARAEERI